MSHPDVLRHAIRRGAYHDSLVLMGLHAALARQPDVVDAGAAMANVTNLELLAATGLLPDLDLSELGGGDLLVVVRANTSAAADAALDQIDDLLQSHSQGTAHGFRPRSLTGALSQLPGAGWVMISVPGPYAAALARDALYLDLDVFLYSDNVPLDQEVELKRLAARRGRLVLGPDCGTAIIDGIGLGFANRVRRGPVGLVGASGTGLQAVAVGLDRLGSGVAQAIGTGGRDLSAEVGGATTLAALERLAQDPETKVVVLLSKQPAAAVAARLLERATALDKPVVVYFQGGRRQEVTVFNGEPAARGGSRDAQVASAVGPDARSRDAGNAGTLSRSGNAADGPAPPQDERADLHHELPGYWTAGSLEETVRIAQALAEGRSPVASTDSEVGIRAVREGSLRGLFGGGTLAAEAMQQLAPHLQGLDSNLAGYPSPADSSPADGAAAGATAHTILDLGDDALTQGRPHPMIDPTPQAERLRQAGADAGVEIVLFDLVLGDGAHADPAAVLAPAVEDALGSARSEDRRLEIIAIVIGTELDPQGFEQQVERLTAAGAVVVRSVDRAVQRIVRPEEVGSGGPPHQASMGLLEEERSPAAPLSSRPAVINVGLEVFFDSLEAQGVEAVHLDWRPPAGGDQRLAGIIERLKAADRRPRDSALL